MFFRTRKTKGGNKKDKNRRPDSCIAFDAIGDIAKQYGISEQKKDLECKVIRVN